jgi:hypothetical protein
MVRRLLGNSDKNTIRSMYRPIGTGRLRARRRFGYWREQIGHLRDQSGHHFEARRQNSSLKSRVVQERLWKTLSPLVVRRQIAKELYQGFPRYLREVAGLPLKVVRGGSRNTSFTWSSLSTTTTKLR